MQFSSPLTMHFIFTKVSKWKKKVFLRFFFHLLSKQAGKQASSGGGGKLVEHRAY